MLEKKEKKKTRNSLTSPKESHPPFIKKEGKGFFRRQGKREKKGEKVKKKKPNDCMSQGGRQEKKGGGKVWLGKERITNASGGKKKGVFAPLRGGRKRKRGKKTRRGEKKAMDAPSGQGKKKTRKKGLSPLESKGEGNPEGPDARIRKRKPRKTNLGRGRVNTNKKRGAKFFPGRTVLIARRKKEGRKGDLDARETSVRGKEKRRPSNFGSDRGRKELLLCGKKGKGKKTGGKGHSY